MAVNHDVREIVRILDEEGFSALAGELLMEIGLGREVDSDGDLASESSFIEEESDLDLPGRREPIPDDEQLEEAINFLRLRLVEPMRRLAEADHIADELSQDKEPADAKLPRKVVRIAFVDSAGDLAQGFERTEQARENQSVEELAKILDRIAATIR